MFLFAIWTYAHLMIKMIGITSNYVGAKLRTEYKCSRVDHPYVSNV